MISGNSALVASFVFLSAFVPITSLASEGGNNESAQIIDPDGTVISVKKRADGKIVKTVRQGNKVKVIVVEPVENPLLKLFKRKD